jgi:DNA invertase Pin-like site-specific DNA recombinase
MNIAIYLRKSRAEENESTEETLNRHKEQLLNIVKVKKYNIIDIFEEVVSGENISNRPKMQELLENVEEKKYNAVLCMDIDRLGRGSMAEQGLILEAFKSTNTLIITPKKIYNLSDDSDEMATEFETFIARYELKKIKKRMQQGKKKTIEEGYHISEPSFGYEREYIKSKPTLKLVPDQAKIVRLIFDMYLTGEQGTTKIANYLNSLNIKTRKNTPFAPSSVRHILRNPIYIGKIIYNRITYKRQKGKKTRQITNDEDAWITSTGNFPTLVTEEEFNKVKEIMENNLTIKTKFNKQPNNSLAGLIVCSVCGKKMRKQAYKDRKPTDIHLYCSTVGCTKSNRFDYVEKEILTQLENFVLQKYEPPKKASKTNEKKENEKLIIETELSKLKAQKEQLHTLLEQKVYDNKTFIERNKIITDKINELTKQLNLSAPPIAEKEINIRETKEKIIKVLDIYENSSIAEKNKYLKTIIDKIIYSKPKDEKNSTGFSLDIHLKYN